MKPLWVRNCALGSGMPKICVPLMAKTEEELRALARREVLLCLASGAFLGLHFAAYFESLRYTSNSVSGNTI